MKTFMAILKFLGQAVGIYLLGGITLLILGFLGSILPGFVNYVYSLPYWKISIAYIILGCLAYAAYKEFHEAYESKKRD